MLSTRSIGSMCVTGTTLQKQDFPKSFKTTMNKYATTTAAVTPTLAKAWRKKVFR